MQFKKRNRDKEREPRKSSFAVYAVWLARNVLFMGLALLLVKYVLTEQPAYRWVYRELLKKNMEAIKKYPDLTFEQKMQMKLGVDYEYLLFIRQLRRRMPLFFIPLQRLSGRRGARSNRKSIISCMPPVSCIPAGWCRRTNCRTACMPAR
ncbi:hypothetical protein [Bacteroides gallinarum]|uniref:hypothetical protein n=1 Tax=Bacteroides gallinarum TaxID=376806 RepID=UPI001F49F1A0|nr:hypothetical protein [Bacteroides gallinarum]